MGAESANDDEDYSCCCCSCLSISKTAATFLKYVFILFITWVISLLLLMPDLREKAVGNNTLCVSYLSKETCSNFFGYNAVYRVYFAIGFVHFVMSLCLIGATSSESGLRTRIHHGLWSVKCLVLIGLASVMFFITGITSVFKILMYVGMACGFLFSLAEVLILVDLVHRCNDSWGGTTDDGSTKKSWSGMAMFSSIIMYLVAIISAAILYVKFTGNDKCTTNKFFIIFIICHCLAACGLAMIPAIRRAQSGTGSLQSAIMILFALLLTWSAVSHQPYNSCTMTIPSNLHTGLSLQAIISTIIVFVVLFYGSIGSSQARLKQRIWPITDEQKYHDNDHYSFSFVHFLMFLGSFHIMMSLTNWYSPGSKVYVPSWVSIWAKMGSCCICMWVYLWTLLAPLFKSEEPQQQEKRDLRKEFSQSLDSSKLNSSVRKVSEANSNTIAKEEGPNTTTSRPSSIFGRENDSKSPFSVKETQGVLIAHGSMSRKGSIREATPENGNKKEMFRLEGKVMKLQEKIAKLQTKVANLQRLEM